MNLIEEIREKLFELRDEKYCDFQSKLIPTVDPERMIGVRTPELRKYAAELKERSDIQIFLRDLPHYYFDENQLHAFIISGIKDYGTCVGEVIRFLPQIDNWATCDQLSPRVFKKEKSRLLPEIKIWLSSDHCYTKRFGIGMLMQHFLDDDFDLSYPEAVSKIRSEEYYVNMMIAWYFATALAKQYDAVLPFIEKRKLEPSAHNKAIQKAVESYRITTAQKEYLRKLRIRKRIRKK